MGMLYDIFGKPEASSIDFTKEELGPARPELMRRWHDNIFILENTPLDRLNLTVNGVELVGDTDKTKYLWDTHRIRPYKEIN